MDTSYQPKHGGSNEGGNAWVVYGGWDLERTGESWVLLLGTKGDSLRSTNCLLDAKKGKYIDKREVKPLLK
jgi:hypothetical protein